MVIKRNIYISYRRVGKEGYAERVNSRLQAKFEKNAVFMDFTNVGLGEDFIDAISQAIGSCIVVIVLIGPGWHLVKDEMGRKRLDDPNDFVRVEDVPRDPDFLNLLNERVVAIANHLTQKLAP